MSFVAIGWQSSAFTSWNWSSGGSEEILQHPGFHVMAMRWLNMPQCVEVVQKRGCNMALYAIPPINTARAGSKILRCTVSRGIKTPRQINHSQASIPLPLLTDTSPMAALPTRFELKDLLEMSEELPTRAESTTVCMYTNTSAVSLTDI